MSNLSDEEFKKLYIRYKHGDGVALEILVEANQGLVVHIADRHATQIHNGKYERGFSSEVSWEDLRQAGNFGLTRALQGFDIEKASIYGRGVRKCFDTYSGYWIEKEIRLFIISCLVIKNARGKFRPIISIYNPRTDDGRNGRKFGGRGDGNSGPQAPKPKESFAELIQKMIDCLTLNQKEAIVFRYGLRDGIEMTPSEIGDRLGEKEDCIESRLVQALKKLRIIYENYEKTGKVFLLLKPLDK